MSQFASSSRWQFLSRAWVVLAFALVPVGAGAGGRAAEPSPDGVPQRLVLALDGIPFNVFVQMQQEGHFRTFRSAARMVSTFPSLSDVSFAAIGGGKIPDGYQNMRFDPELNKVVGNTIGSLSSKLHPNLDSDNLTHSSVHRMVGYMALRRESATLGFAYAEILSLRETTQRPECSCRKRQAADLLDEPSFSTE